MSFCGRESKKLVASGKPDKVSYNMIILHCQCAVIGDEDELQGEV